MQTFPAGAKRMISAQASPSVTTLNSQNGEVAEMKSSACVEVRRGYCWTSGLSERAIAGQATYRLRGGIQDSYAE